MMGDSGPCGACTEIHYDLENRNDMAHLVNMSDPTLIEVWNLVFMEYNASTTEHIKEKNPDDIYFEEPSKHIITSYTKLDKRFVDTGMGLERLAMIMQNKKSLYQIDVFKKLIAYAQILSSGEEYTDDYDLENKKDIAFRIFVDHIRTCIIAIFNGAVFDCNGRGFILRKIFRRLLMNYYIYLNNCNVVPITEHHIFPALITEVLNFYLFKKHDTGQLTKFFHDEEKLYIGKICKMKNLYDMQIKKRKFSDDIIAEFLKNSDNIKSTMGVDEDIIKNLHRINIMTF